MDLNEQRQALHTAKFQESDMENTTPTTPPDILQQQVFAAKVSKGKHSKEP